MAIALSWSRVSDWMQCNRKFYLKYIAKQFPVEDASKSPHLVKGEQMHKQMERYTIARLNGQDVSNFEAMPACKEAFPMIERVLSAFEECYPEQQVAATKDWVPDEWFGKQVGWRAIWDLSGISRERKIGLLIDWKTGKVTDYDQGEPGQLHLSAIMAMDRYGLEEVTVFYAFLEHKVRVPANGLKLTRKDDYPHIRSFFDRIYETVNRETEWKPLVNQYCNHCPATKAQCQFSRKI